MASITLDTPALDALDAAVDKLDELAGLEPAERALRVTEIRMQLDAALARVREEAVAHALLIPVGGLRGPRRLTIPELATRMGLSRGSIMNMVSSYRAWVAGQRT
jgi:hypothetical protein